MTQQIAVGAGLLGRFGFEENGGTTSATASRAAVNGTTVGGPTWAQGAPFSGPSDDAPATPTGLFGVPDDEQVSLSWNANSEADLAGYNVYRSTSLPVDTTTPINGATLVPGHAFADATVNNTPSTSTRSRPSTAGPRVGPHRAAQRHAR